MTFVIMFFFITILFVYMAGMAAAAQYVADDLDHPVLGFFVTIFGITLLVCGLIALGNHDHYKTVTCGPAKIRVQGNVHVICDNGRPHFD